MSSLHPAFFLLFGGLLLPLLPLQARRVALVLLPLIGLYNLIGYDVGASQTYAFAGYELHIVRADKLSLLFGYLFHRKYWANRNI